MKVVNVALNGVYTDGFSYHENLLPKYHKINGNDVSIVTSEYVFNNRGEMVKTDGPKDYIDDNGIHVIRLPIKGDKHISYRLKRFEKVYETLCELKPDIIFCHLCQFLDVLQVVKYRKAYPKVKLYVDSHADYVNSAHTFLSKYVLHGLLWRYCAHRALPYTDKFYGVLPARVDFLVERYKLPKDKVELLVMGADDVLVTKASEEELILKVRLSYNIHKDDFLIVTGGKIDLWKRQTLLLMDAVNNLDRDQVKLLVFGSVVPELKDEINKRCSERVQYIGWLESKDTYPLFASCQLAAFPGSHSVFWEQVCGQGIPMIVKEWAGITHIDCGGNVLFLKNDSEEEIRTTIKYIVDCPEVYDHMRSVAETEAAAKFSYKELAKRSLS